MTKTEFKTYDLLLSYDPCEVFDYFNVDELHGLDKNSCKRHPNTNESSYISGWSNFYPNSERRFVYINLSRCNNDFELITLINHELLHQSFYLYDYNIHLEEDIISWAEMETSNIFRHIKKNELQTDNSIKENKIS